jgi:hypothetical protein
VYNRSDALKGHTLKGLYLVPFVIETFARLRGALAFLETMNDGIPTVEEKESRYLEQLAAEGGWEHGEYAAERDVLNDKFHTWVPTFAAYSVTILLYSIVETQLDAFAGHMGKRLGSKLQVRDMAGKGVDRSARYLERVLSIDVKTDPAWSRLKDLQSLRNIMVHRGGKRGESKEQQDTVDELVRRYPQALELRKADGFHEQIWMSMNLCRDFAQDIDGFFDRAFKASGLPNRHMQLES